MSYYTTVKVISPKGKPTKAYVTCGGVGRGWTDENTGEISFDLGSSGSYSVKAENSLYGSYSSTLKGGSILTIRLPG